MRNKVSPTLRLGAYQGPAVPGDLTQNGAEALRLLAEAHERGVDFACLPESYLSGYGKPETLKQGAVSIRDRWFRDWLRQTRFGSMVSIVGFTEKRGRRFYNSALVAQRGRLLGVYSKAFSGSEYEDAVCTFATRFPVFRAHGVTFGVIICADSGRIEPSLLLAARGARLIFSPHYNFIPMNGLNDHWLGARNNHIARAVENECWVVRSNSVTPPMHKMGDEIGFGYGDSFILDPRGVPMAEAGLFSTGWITADAPRTGLQKKQVWRVAMIPKQIRDQIVQLYSRRVGVRLSYDADAADTAATPTERGRQAKPRK